MRTLHKMFGKSILASICIVGALIIALFPAAVVGAGSSESGFHISQWTGETWEQIYQHQFQVQYSTEAFTVDVVDGKVALRIVQVGTPFADVDQISLTADGEELTPEYARYTESGQSIVEDILELDHNVVIAHEQEIEISWDVPAGNDGVTVYLTANEYGHGPSVRFPETGYATYEMGFNTGSITVDGLIAETDGMVPLYTPYWQSTSGHPDGYTYIYVCDDEEYVYFSLDVTGDNTNEYGEDWAEIIILQPDGSRKAFRIDDYDNTWGTSGFGLTSKVSYKHQTCEFAIPKSIIGNENIEFSLAYYGTFAGDYELHPDSHLDIQIDGDSSEGQVFQVGETLNITGLVTSWAAIKLYNEPETGQAYVYEELSVDGPSGYDYDWYEVLDEGTGNNYTGASIYYSANWTSLSYNLTHVGLHTITLYSYARVSGQTQYSGDVNEEDSAEITLDFWVGLALSIDDVTVNEDGGYATFNVSLSSDPDSPVTVDYSTSDGLATAGSDYTAVGSTTLTFNSSAPLSQTIDVAIIDDALHEVNETFHVNLTNATGEAGISDDTGIGIIIDNDDGPTIGSLFMVNGAYDLWTELIYDDGTAESSLNHGSDLGTSLVKFTVPGEPIRLTDLYFWMAGGNVSAELKVIIFDKDGNQVVYLSEIYNSWDDGTWNSIDLDSESIPALSDDFYAGIQHQTASSMYVGMDTSSVAANRSYWGYPPYETLYQGQDNLMIRVGGYTLAGNEIVELDPDTGTVMNTIPSPSNTDGGGDGLAYGDGRMFFTTIDTSIIYEIDPSTGDIINRLGPEPKVAVYAADSASHTADVQAKLTSTGLFSQVEAFLVESGDPVPTLAELQEYDAVLVYSNGEFGNSTAMGDVLADYVDVGGGAVIATFTFWDPAQWGGGIGGRISSGGYLPFTQGEQSTGANLTLVADEPEHPILSGVTSFNGGLTSWFNTVNLTSQAYLVAHWSNDVPLIAVQDPIVEGAGRVVGLNFFPLSSDAQSGLWDSSTDGDLLMANSLLFAAFNYEYEVDALGFSGDALYALQYGANATIRVLDPDTGANITTLEPGIHLVGGGTFAGTRGSLFFSGYGDADTLIYEINTTTGAVINSFSPPVEGEEDGLYGLGFSSSRNTLFVGYFDSNMVYEVDPDDGTVINSFLGPEGAEISALAADEYECEEEPCLPVVGSVTETAFDTDTITHNVSMPTMVDAGDLLIVLFTNDGYGVNATTPIGWNLLDSRPANGCTLSAYYRVATGTEGGTGVDITTSSSEEAVAQVYRITNWHGTTPPEISTDAVGLTASPDPYGLNPSGWDLEDTLWIAVAGQEFGGGSPTYPTDYIDGISTISSNHTTRCGMHSAIRINTVSSENPGPFGIGGSAQWVAYTIAVRPPACGGGTTCATFYSSGDAYIETWGSNYSTIHDAASGTIWESDFLLIGQDAYAGPDYYIDRAFVYFNTTAIPPGAVITGASIYLYGATDWSDDDFSLVIVNGQPTYPHSPLVAGDYDLTQYSGNGGSFNTSGFSTSGYNEIVLNATGMGWINKTGTTKLGIFSSEDIDDSGVSTHEYVMVASSRWEGTDHDPYLEVCYTTGDGNNPPVITSDGGGSTATIHADEYQTAVTTVAATDPDAGDILTYSIIGGADQSEFSIGSSSGVLTFNSAPDYGSPTDANTDGTYEVTVQVTDDDASPLTDTQAISVIVDDVNPPAPTLVSPANGATINTTTPTLDWDPVTGIGAVNYSVRWDDEETFSGGPPTAGVGNNTDYTIPSGLAAGTWYWQVQAHDDSGSSGWSSYWSFTIPSPPTPTLVSPANGATITDTTPTLDWDPITGIGDVTYSVRWDDEETFSGGPPTAGVGNNTDYTIPSGLAAGTWYWQVQAHDDSGGSGWSSYWSFTISPPATTTVGDGSSPVDKYVRQSSVNKALSAFTLSTDTGTDTVTGLIVIGTGTTNVALNGVKLWLDSGSQANEWDGTDTQIGSGITFSTDEAHFTGLSIPVNSTATQYLITYDIAASPTNGATLTAYVDSVSATNSVINNDDGDATLTIDDTQPTVSLTAYSPDPTNDSTPSYSGSASDVPAGSGILDIEFKVDGGIWTDVDSFTPDNPVDPFTFTTGVLADGTHTIYARAMDEAGNWNEDSDTLTIDTTDPAVTINQAGTQADPTSASPIDFTVVFSEPVTGFATGDVDFSGGTAPGTLVGTVTEISPNDGTTYNVAVSGMTGDGTIIATIPADAASDAASNGNEASTSTDNTVTYDTSGGDTPPVANNNSVSTPEDTPMSFVDCQFPFTDDDGDLWTAVKIMSQATDGTLKYSGSTFATPFPIDIGNVSNLTFVPDPDENGSPYATFDFQVQAGGAWSNTATETITVTAVNDCPSFTKGGDVLVDEDSGLYSSAGWASGISPGPSDESGQSLTFYVYNDNNSLFLPQQPGISATGTLTFTPTANANGSANVSVYLTDDGGTALGGCDNTTVEYFTITVDPVNDCPIIDSVSPATQTVQFSDLIQPITITAHDVDNDLGELSLGYVPVGLSVDDSTPGTWIISGQFMDDHAMDWIIGVTDGECETPAATITSLEECVVVRFDNHNPMSVEIDAADTELDSEAEFTVHIKQDPDGYLGWADLAWDDVAMDIIPVAGGGAIHMAYNSSSDLDKFSDGASVSFTFNPPGDDEFDIGTYIIEVTIDNDYYKVCGGAESLLMVYDPDVGASGSGTFEDCGDTYSFAFLVDYNKKGKNLRGSLVVIRELSGGGIYRIQSNALYDLALIEDSAVDVASFSGKCTYIGPDVLNDEMEPQNVGGQEFVVYLKDYDTSADPDSATPDQFWFTVLGRDFTLDFNSNNRADSGEIMGIDGDIVIPDRPANVGRGKH